MAGAEAADFIRTSIEWAALGIEVLAVVVIVVGVLWVAIRRGTMRYLFAPERRAHTKATSTNWASPCCWGWTFWWRETWSRPSLLSLLWPMWRRSACWCSIRTFLSLSLTVEMEGRWPWQARTIKDRLDQTDEEVREPHGFAQ